MKRILFILTCLLYCYQIPNAQIDTLTLVQIESLTTPDSITSLDFADLQNDGHKQLIVGSRTSIRIFNSQNGDSLWSSPNLIRPSQVSAYDINGDGYQELAIKDSLSLKVFDTVNSSLIWESPALRSLSSDFTFGDLNNDGNAEIVIVQKELFTNYGNYDHLDTTWISIFYGPNFETQDNMIILMMHYQHYVVTPPTVSYGNEFINKVIIANLGIEGAYENRIFLFTTTTVGHDGNHSNGYTTSGITYIINPQSLNIVHIDTSGMLLAGDTTQVQNRKVLYSVCQKTYYYQDTYLRHYEAGSRIKSVNWFSADLLTSRDTLWQISDSDHNPPDWSGFLISDISLQNQGYELCYCTPDAMKLLAFPTLYPLQQNAGTTGAGLINIYNSNSLYSSPQIMYGKLYKLFDGPTLLLSAEFSNQGIRLNSVEDLDNDGEDEFLSVSNNIIHIFHAISTSVSISDNQGTLPVIFRLCVNYPNPFNPTTTIQYDLPKPSFVSIDIYDLLGRKIEMLVSSKQEAGTYSIIWDGKDRSSGIYFYRLKAGDFTETKKMLLLK